MAPHLSAKELDKIQKMTHAGKTPQQIQEHIGKARARLAHVPDAPPCVDAEANGAPAAATSSQGSGGVLAERGEREARRWAR